MYSGRVTSALLANLSDWHGIERSLNDLVDDVKDYPKLASAPIRRLQCRAEGVQKFLLFEPRVQGLPQTNELWIRMENLQETKELLTPPSSPSSGGPAPRGLVKLAADLSLAQGTSIEILQYEFPRHLMPDLSAVLEAARLCVSHSPSYGTAPQQSWFFVAAVLKIVWCSIGGSVTECLILSL